METEPKAKYINGYWRGKKAPIEKQDLNQALPALVLGGATLILVAILLWQTTLALVVSGTGAYIARRVLSARQDRLTNGLRVTYMNQQSKVL